MDHSGGDFKEQQHDEEMVPEGFQNPYHNAPPGQYYRQRPQRPPRRWNNNYGYQNQFQNQRYQRPDHFRNQHYQQPDQFQNEQYQQPDQFQNPDDQLPNQFRSRQQQRYPRKRHQNFHQDRNRNPGCSNDVRAYFHPSMLEDPWAGMEPKASIANTDEKETS